MREFSARTRTVVLAVTLAAAVLPTCVWAQASEPSVVWPTYHMDNFRKGQNENCKDISNPASLNLIWVFPRGVGSQVDEELLTVDDREPECIVNNPWTGALTSEDSYEGHVYTTAARSRADVDSNGKPNYQRVPVIWEFPKGVPKGRYRIMIRVPAIYNEPGPNDTPYRNTSQAEYTVYDNTGATTFKFDQSFGSGEWRLLTERQFDFSGTGYYRVELSNVTDDTVESIAAGNVVIVADAIRFVPGTGMEIYASVASAQIPWSGQWEEFKDKDRTGAEQTIPAGSWSGTIPAVYACSVESPLANSAAAPDTGAVYCINSVTTSLNAYNDLTGNWQTNWALSKFLGTPVWRYPRAAEQRYLGSKVSGLDVPPNEIEGPIMGGIYASPTLATIIDGSRARLVCYVAAMDMQVYALDAVTGELLWKGPGVTLGEKSPTSRLNPAAIPIRPADAFGGEYHLIPCSATGAEAASWEFTDDLRKANGGEPDEGLAYSVYVWIPAAGGEALERAHDATYTITYVGSDGNAASTEVKLDQARLENQGRWVQLGTSYFNVTKVSLSQQTELAAPGRSASSYAVVADACMIVPNTIDAFGYCTPVVDIDEDPNADPKPRANNVFAVCAGGRALAFDARITNVNKIGKLKWIYPKVRTARKVTGDADIDDPNMGQMGASPAYWNDKLFIAGFNGTVRRLDNVKGASFTSLPTEGWTWPKDDSDTRQRAGFTSSPAIDKIYNQFVIGSVYGIFYCFSTTGTGGPDSDGLLWKYPDIDENTPSKQLPLGAFRYSTAAIATVKQRRRAWIGSTDGRIYSFDLQPGATDRRLWVEFDDEGNEKAVHGEWYLEPNTLSTVQASVALAGPNVLDNRVVMFVGDMRDNGVLHWYNADDGASDWAFQGTVYTGWRCEGQLFSSPNLTNFQVSGTDVSYVYNGCRDGRVYAWSREGGAWGGRWAGGEWPFEGQPDDRSQMESALAPDTEIQFDVFPFDFWDASNKYAGNCNPTKTDVTETDPKKKQKYVLPDVWPPQWPPVDPNDKWPAIISQNMKQPTTSLVGKTDKEINDTLLKYARERRNHVFPAASKRINSKILYLEWGERLNLIVWNLPGLDFLYPYSSSSGSEGTKRAQIRFTLVNQSPGTSAGSEIRYTGSVSVLKEYTVLDNVKKEAKKADGTHDFYYYEPLRYSDGTEVKRCFALVQLDRELRGTSSNPPSPGPNWKLTVEIKKLSESGKRDAAVIPITLPLPRLKAGTPDASMGAPVPVVKAATQKKDASGNPLVQAFDPQDLGINNPLAINTGTSSLAWSYTANRDDPEAHFNGNGIFNSAGEFLSSPLSLTLGSVAHGTSSPVSLLGVMDRGGTGLIYPPANTQNKIETFRITGADLRWRGGTRQIELSGGVFFPWEFRPESADYPHIYKRYQRFRKYFDDADPSRVHTALPPLIPNPADPANYDQAKLSPDTVEVSVDVPRFQPANTRGYGAVMQAYVDSNRNGGFDSGNVIYGRASTYQEAYREFRVDLTVPPDPRIEVEEQLIDVGQVPHGFGQYLGLPPGDFTAVNPDPAIKQFFKTVTIRNAGNVNLYNVRIGDANAPLYLIKDPYTYGKSLLSSPVLPGWDIRSSVEPFVPLALHLQAMKGEPFITLNPATQQPLGYTITKSRVGDPDASTMSIPDARKWDMDYRYSGGYTRDAAKSAYALALQGAGLDPSTAQSMNPFPPEVSVTIPVSQPVGTYVAPFVPVYASFGNPASPGTAVAAPTFGLKVTVRESQVTGGTFPAALPQIDVDSRAKFGDATPAAFRDAQTGNVYLFWSSNRPFDDAIRAALANAPPNDPIFQEFAAAPWFINRALLAWDQQNNTWVPAGPQMWGIPLPTNNPYLPFFPATGTQWPPLIGSATGRQVMEWRFGGRPTGLQSVRHHSPFVGEDPDVAPDANAGRTWLVWAGMANVVDTSSGKVSHEYRVFYTDATHGDVTAQDRKIYSIEHDPGMDKRYPCVVVYQGLRPGEHPMWIFYQGGESGRWSIYYTVNQQFPAYPNTLIDPNGQMIDAWSEDVRLRTPDCLTSVSSPNAVLRRFWVDLRPDTPLLAGAKHLFDIVYAGINRLNQTADIMLGRYAAVVPDDPNSSAAPGNKAQPMPRVFGEKLARDPKFGFFTSQHLAWIRLDPKRVAQGLEMRMPDDWGNYDINNPNPDLPFIRVYFPKGYVVDSQTTLPPGSFVSGTDGTVRDASGALIYAPPGPIRLDSAATETDFRLEIDQATGVCAYKYPKGSLTEKILGEMLVDFSAGIVRFTNPLKEVKNPDGTVNAPEVRADYTPQTWRLTTDLAVDNSPRAFIERTLMNPMANPGMCAWKSQNGSDKPAPVDRLWVLWRRAGTSVESSTIFWKTYRVGVDLSRLVDQRGNPLPPIPMNPDGTWSSEANLQVNNNLGPFEVDRTGTRIYFTQVDERYRSLFKIGTRSFFTNPAPPAAVWDGARPVPITISYKDANGNTRTANAYDVFWLEELPEQSLFGFVGSASVNEGSVYAFADMYDRELVPPAAGGTQGIPRPYSKVWVFWTTTRGGTTDLCWATLSPNFAAR
ncbi:MAG: hypothetical protein ACP5R5_01220 [Armatimonadota bacterium]